ncbi:MAG TPA: 2-hydroxychromene-2-carboxylate isomerase [Polyangia bacterium]|nr:2-hydroxychromene-2-carboxylate isomerase [Polyangia bacterium]
MKLVFYYDVVCPYAYLASTRIEALAARARVECAWTPILLGGVFRAIQSPDVPAAHMPPAKARLNLLDLARYASLYGVTLKLPAEHPRRTVDAMRLCHAVDGADRVRLSHALYRAYFAEGRDVADRRVLGAIARDCGLDENLVERVETPAIKDALRAATDEAIADGVFGVPGFVVVSGGARKLFWGQDRMHLVERALAA